MLFYCFFGGLGIMLIPLGAIFMLYILLCCVNGSAQPDDTARWLDQRSSGDQGARVVRHRFYGESTVEMLPTSKCSLRLIIIYYVLMLQFYCVDMNNLIICFHFICCLDLQ